MKKYDKKHPRYDRVTTDVLFNPWVSAGKVKKVRLASINRKQNLLCKNVHPNHTYATWYDGFEFQTIRIIAM